MIKNKNENKPQRSSFASLDSQTNKIENNSEYVHQPFQSQNKVIQEAVEQLIRYQKYAESYKLTSNEAVRQFLMKSTVLSPQLLHSLSIMNDPNVINKINKDTK